MVDTTKRAMLKTIAVGTTLVSAPVVASKVATSSRGRSMPTGNVRSMGTNHATVNGIELEIDAIPDTDSVWIRVSNITDRSVEVRHINPGVLQFDGRRYDVNSVFDGPTSVYQGNSIVIHEDESYSFIVAPMMLTTQAIPTPPSPISQFTATVNPQTGTTTGDVLTPRMVLA